MFPLRVRVFACALVVGAAVLPLRAAEVPAVPVCGGCCAPATTRYYCAPAPVYRTRRCYDPCESVGPVRRFLRRVFLPPCPRCCPPAPVVGVVPAPAVFVPAPVAAPPAVDPGRPVPPPPPALPGPFPSAGSSYRRPPNVLTPPLPPPPIHLEHLASRSGSAE